MPQGVDDGGDVAFFVGEVEFDVFWTFGYW